MGPDVTALLAAPEGIFDVLKLRLCTKNTILLTTLVLHLNLDKAALFLI